MLLATVLTSTFDKKSPYQQTDRDKICNFALWI